MKPSSKKPAHRTIRKAALLNGARTLLKQYEINVGSIERRANRDIVGLLKFNKQVAAKLKPGRNRQNRKRRLLRFAIVYAHYLVLENRPNFKSIVQACADEQDMTGTPRSKISSAVLRCIMGLKKGSAKIRAEQRDQISKASRAIAYLKKNGKTPDEVAILKPGNGNSESAWAAAYWRRGRGNGSSEKDIARVPALDVRGAVGRNLILLARKIGKDRVEISDWAPLGRHAVHAKQAKRFWKKTEAAAWKIGARVTKPVTILRLKSGTILRLTSANTSGSSA